MIIRLFFAAILAGVISGVVISLVYQFSTVPLILRAEVFEANRAHSGESSPKLQSTSFNISHTNNGKTATIYIHDNKNDKNLSKDKSKNNIERIIYTSITTILTGIGFALLLVSGMAIRGDPVNFRVGILWGVAGFSAFTLAPALGLPPELPGMAAGDLPVRQTWWITTILLTILALWTLIFSQKISFRIIAIILLVAPHVVGAPEPEILSANTLPPELAAKFASVSIGVSALFWALLGGLSAYFFDRFNKKAI
ncbi:MAG: hypothetical protein CMM58_03140 [Rhodospirillaceae bacterium]|nr:hypothetical protein [Rhodospirillaceae bacterium]|tara:strand:+ start:445 stop:1206 length:762 start_codon:yes stop_codon:yes gene_type:complete